MHSDARSVARDGIPPTRAVVVPWEVDQSHARNRLVNRDDASLPITDQAKLSKHRRLGNNVLKIFIHHARSTHVPTTELTTIMTHKVKKAGASHLHYRYDTIVRRKHNSYWNQCLHFFETKCSLRRNDEDRQSITAATS